MIDWKQVYRDVDRMDAKAFADLFAQDGTMTFGNAPPLVGRRAIKEGVAGFFGSIEGLRHEFVASWLEDGVAIHEFRATYRRKDGQSVTIPALTVFRLEGDRVKDARVFYDPTPIFA